MAGLFAKEFEDDDQVEVREVRQSPVRATTDVDEQMAEAERRLAKAAYYKAIVQNGVVEDDGTAQASEVNAEACVWARQRMADLLGLAKAPSQQRLPAAELPFTEQEIVALKKLVERSLTLGTVAAEPVVRKVSVQQVATKKPSSAAPPRPPQPTAAPPEKPKKKGKVLEIVADPSTGKPDYNSVPSGVVFRDIDGQTYRFVNNQNFDPDRSEEALRAQGASEEEIAKLASHPRVKSKVVARAGHAVRPMPDKYQMAGISAAQATDTINAGGSASAVSPIEPDTLANPSMYARVAASALNS